jgi:hypothetical protein
VLKDLSAREAGRQQIKNLVRGLIFINDSLFAAAAAHFVG